MMLAISMVEVFATLAPLPILISALIGIRQLKYTSKSEKYIVALLLVASTAQLMATIFWWKEMNNLFISHFFTILECYLLLHYYSHQFSNAGKKWLIILAYLFVIFASADIFFSFGNFEMNALSKGVECFLLISVSLLIWRKTMVELTEVNLLAQPLFWINSAVLIYFSANALLFIFSESILSSGNKVGLSLWAIHLFFMTIYYAFIGIALWKVRRA